VPPVPRGRWAMNFDRLTTVLASIAICGCASPVTPAQDAGNNSDTQAIVDVAAADSAADNVPVAAKDAPDPEMAENADALATPDGTVHAVADSAVDVAQDANSCTTTASLKSLKQEYFGGSCAFSSCHAGPKPAGGLDLAAADVRAELVGVFSASKAAAGKMRVAAGNSAKSFLYLKVYQPPDNLWMPPGVDDPLDPQCSIAALKLWIDSGALDN